MTKRIGILKRFNNLFNIVDQDTKPNAVNADYKLVVVDVENQTCTVHYFFTVSDAVKYASPPNIYLGNGYEYIIYHRIGNNQESFVKLNNLNKENHYYGCNLKGSGHTGGRDTQVLLPGAEYH